METKYRLGLDLGANSIGWCALRLDDGDPPEPVGLLDLGVRVYPDGRNPKDGSSLAAQRRGPRAMRRNRDRYLQRRENLLKALSRHGLMPANDPARRQIATRDPYALREAALHRRLDLFELGRALFHLNQHRGFKSNRKIDRADNEGGLIKDAAANTMAALQRDGFATIGAWLADKHAKRSGVRVRLAGSGKTAAYPFYPTRDMIEAEFDTIWTAQAGWNQTLTDPMREELRGIIFHQRPLRPVQVGKCWLEPAEDRAPRALPTAQRARIAQTLSHLRLAVPGMPERALTAKEHAVLSVLLYRGQDQTFIQVRRKLGLHKDTDFNTRDDKLVGCATAARLGTGKKAVIGEAWHTLDLATQDAAVRAILDANTDEETQTTLIALGIATDAAAQAAKAVLPDSHAALSAKALGKILPFLEAGQRYDEAIKSAGYAHHSDRRTGEIRADLPYYGDILCQRIGTGTGKLGDSDEKRLGKAANPTVHVTLNEVRRVVNAIIARHGPPAEIVVETLRELGRSARQRQEYEKTQKQNRDKNDDRRKQLAEMGVRDSGANRMRLRLWEEQGKDPKNRVCPYSGTIITARMAVSDAIEEDHILPFADTLDDSAANRVLVMREQNRVKGKSTPFAAFGHTPQWPEILERIKNLDEAKRWRFAEDAEKKFAREGDFLARHLTDSATIAIWAKEYLEVLAPGKVWSIPGRLTGLARHALGLTSASVLGKGGARKDRDDHRHHAIDAVVVALSDRGLLQRMTVAAKKADERGQRLLVEFPPPWDGFIADVAARAQALVVSHKPDTGWQGALHNDTAYGAIKGAKGKEPNVVVRKPVDALAGWSPQDIRDGVRDPALAEKIAALLVPGNIPASKTALAGLTYSGDHTVRRVRTVERLESTIAITDRQTRAPYKLLKRDGNHRAELWRMPGGKLELRVVPTFNAAEQVEAARLGRKIKDPRPHPAAKLLMQLHKDDFVAFGEGTERQLLRVVKMSGNNVTLAAGNEAGNLKARDASKDDTFKYVGAGARKLIVERARKVHVTPDGRVLDNGPPK